MEMDLFEERREAAPDAERRPEAIYVYGVDVMSTKDLLTYFGDYGPTFVEWINDSSCEWRGRARVWVMCLCAVVMLAAVQLVQCEALHCVLCVLAYPGSLHPVATTLDR